jgi:hypothetical protein
LSEIDERRRTDLALTIENFAGERVQIGSILDSRVNDVTKIRRPFKWQASGRRITSVGL